MVAVSTTATSEAKAAIVYYQPNGGAGWVIPADNFGLYINVETQVTGSSPVAGWDLSPYGSNELKWYNGNDGGSGIPSQGSGELRYSPGGQGVGNLPLGTAVGPSGSFFDSGSLYTSETLGWPTGDVAFGSNPGEWNYNASNYFGFKFVSDFDSLTHYGWGRMLVGADVNDRTIVEIGYENVAGASILVGATASPAAVPGPLPLFGAAAAFGWSRRLRRRALQASRRSAPVPAFPTYLPPA